MPESATIHVRLPKEAVERPDALAATTKRSRSFLAAEAIADFLAVNAWQVEETRQAVEKADAGGPFVAHEDVDRWLASWGTDGEEEPPVATITR